MIIWLAAFLVALVLVTLLAIAVKGVPKLAAEEGEPLNLSCQTPPGMVEIKFDKSGRLLYRCRMPLGTTQITGLPTDHWPWSDWACAGTEGLP